MKFVKMFCTKILMVCGPRSVIATRRQSLSEEKLHTIAHKK